MKHPLESMFESDESGRTCSHGCAGCDDCTDFGDDDPATRQPAYWPIDESVAGRIAEQHCLSYETVQLIARQLAVAPPAQTPDALKPGELGTSIEQIAADRYKVVPSHESMFHRFAVVAGNGKQQLYIGREVECENMARKFAGAFLDGAFVQAEMVAPLASVQWPKARDVGRYGDMSREAHIRVGLDSDNDVYVSVWDKEGGATVEFCTPGAGGGKSSETRVALIALMVAMEKDNARVPHLDWWARRMGAAKG
jgi:hypothetical protein